MQTLFQNTFLAINLKTMLEDNIKFTANYDNELKKLDNMLEF